MGDLVQYRIFITTSDKFGAGTDANVYVILRGEEGTSDRLVLDNQDNNFETGKTDVFERSAPNVGRLTEVTVGHDNSGMGAAWQLSSVRVEDGSTGHSYTFDAGDQWFSKDKGDGLIERVLPCTSDTLADKGESQVREEEAAEEEKQDEPAPPPPAPAPEPEPTPEAAPAVQLAKYTITVVTSTAGGSGTDANVHVELLGDSGTSGKLVLDDRHDNFEAGMTDVFTKECEHVGRLRSIKLGFDNSGMLPAWCVAEVRVLDHATGDEYDFPCDDGSGQGLWLKAPKLEATLEPAPRDGDDGQQQEQDDDEQERAAAAAAAAAAARRRQARKPRSPSPTKTTRPRLTFSAPPYSMSARAAPYARSNHTWLPHQLDRISVGNERLCATLMDISAKPGNFSKMSTSSLSAAAAGSRVLPCHIASSGLNRARRDDHIALQNLEIYKRLQAVKPTKETMKAEHDRFWVDNEKYSYNATDPRFRYKKRPDWQD